MKRLIAAALVVLALAGCADDNWSADPNTEDPNPRCFIITHKHTDNWGSDHTRSKFKVCRVEGDR